MTNEPQLDSLLKRMAEAHRPELPSPDLIWWRAQILRKQEQKRRIERPLVLMRLAAAAVCLVSSLALLAANQQLLKEAVGDVGWILPLGIAVLAVFLLSTIVLFWRPAKRARST